MVIRKKPGVAIVPSSEITPQRLYMTRREWVQSTAGAIAAAILAPAAALAAPPADALAITKRVVTTTDTLTPLAGVTSFNNFYEFGSDKDEPAKHRQQTLIIVFYLGDVIAKVFPKMMFNLQTNDFRQGHTSSLL